MARKLLGCWLVVMSLALMAFGVQRVSAERAVVADAVLGALVGRDGNGLCCAIEQGSICEVTPVVSGCSAPLPWQCYCSDPGHYCQVVSVAPKKHDLCQAVTGDTTESWCSLTQMFCWFWKPGTCDNDAGPWSWGGFCFTCGCAVDPEETLRGEGSRWTCLPQSKNC